MGPGVKTLGEREQVTETGKSEHDSETGLFTRPLTGATVILKLAGCPALTAALLGEALILKARPPLTPVPVRDAVCKAVVALSATLKMAVSRTVLEGVNVTLITQLLPEARLAGEGGHVLVCAKSETFAPTNEMPLTIICVFPMFLNVTVCVELEVLATWLPKVSVEGDKLAMGPLPPLVPVPPSATV